MRREHEVCASCLCLHSFAVLAGRSDSTTSGKRRGMNAAARWDDVPLVSTMADGLPGFAEVPDNGYELCIAWAAGPEHLVGVLVEDADCIVREARTDRSGRRTAITRVRTPEEESELSSLVNTFLSEAGIPPRPSRYRWFIELPSSALAGVGDFSDLVSLIRSQQGPDDSAGNVLRAAQSVLNDLYRH